MRSAQLEALVLSTIDAVRSGHHEDDRFEFKRDWPGDDKARQLAGSANRSRGEVLIYVIGLDERTGEVYPPSPTDPADWFAQLEAKFDGPAPELRHHLRVEVSETESVVALEFATSAAPYVVHASKNGGSPELEVPIRSGTRTRSAHRSELLRMLYPTIRLPRTEVLNATLQVGADNDGLAAVLSAWVYFEHIQHDPLFLPLHECHAYLTTPTRVDVRTGIGYPKMRLLLEPSRVRKTLPPSPPGALEPRWDGLDLVRPGAVTVRARWKLSIAEYDDAPNWTSPRVRVAFGVAGVEGRVEVGLAFRAAHGGEGGPDPISDFEPHVRFTLAVQPTE